MKTTSLAFLWHLHQPKYRLRGETVCPLPWVRLHAIRAYYDMVRVLEEFPEIRVTVNLVPVLLEQIRSYEQGGTDLFLEIASLPVEDLDEGQRAFLFEHFFSAEESRMIGGIPAFAELNRRRHQALRVRGEAEAWREFDVSELRDLQLLYDLAWFGFKAREEHPELGRLIERGRGFSREELRAVHAIEREILAAIIPLYARAAASGQIEVSASPYAHPILPLLVDTHAAREAMPQAPLPPRFEASEDARAQVQDSLARLEAELGIRPRGMWPSEGSVSHEVAGLLARCGVAWAASDEAVLAASDREGPAEIDIPWQVAGAEGLDLVFRDHDLSDRVGFTYSRMSAGEAVADFLAAIRQRSEALEEEGLILVALDGENPWEHFPEAGRDFLRTLYGALTGHPTLRCRTVSESLAACEWRGKIRRLHAGSWIRGDFGIWIGGPEKNRAWELLGRVRSEVLGALHDPALPAAARDEAWASLRAAEGSDWFWWLDGQFATAYRMDFDRIFRGHLRQVYEALGRTPPPLLEEPIPSPYRRVPTGALPEAPAWLSPRVDGYETDFFEWEGAIRVDGAALAHRTSMERAHHPLASLEFGFSPAGEFLLRMDPASMRGGDLFPSLAVDVGVRAGTVTRHLAVLLDERGDLRQARRWSAPAGETDPVTTPESSEARAAARKIFELAVPAGELGMEAGGRVTMRVRLRRRSEEHVLEDIDLRVPDLLGAGRLANK